VDTDSSIQQMTETRILSLNGKTYTIQFGDESLHKLIVSRMFPEVPVFAYDLEDCGLIDGATTPVEEQRGMQMASPLQQRVAWRPYSAFSLLMNEPVAVDGACQEYEDSSEDAEYCYSRNSSEEDIPSSDDNQDWDD
jgi:hypothetical protein